MTKEEVDNLWELYSKLYNLGSVGWTMDYYDDIKLSKIHTEILNFNSTFKNSINDYLFEDREYTPIPVVDPYYRVTEYKLTYIKLREITELTKDLHNRCTNCSTSLEDNMTICPKCGNIRPITINIYVKVSVISYACYVGVDNSEMYFLYSDNDFSFLKFFDKYYTDEIKLLLCHRKIDNILCASKEPDFNTYVCNRLNRILNPVGYTFRINHDLSNHYIRIDNL